MTHDQQHGRSAADMVRTVAWLALVAGVVPGYLSYQDARSEDVGVPGGATALVVGGILVWLLLLAVARALDERQ